MISPFSSRGASSKYGCVHARRSGNTTLRPVIFFAIISSLKFPQFKSFVSKWNGFFTLVPMEHHQLYVDFLIVDHHQIHVQIHLFYAKKGNKENKIEIRIFFFLHYRYNDEQFHRQVYCTI